MHTARKMEQKQQSDQVALRELARALAREARLLDDLREVLLRQRNGVATNDANAIESSVHAMGRTLHTLGDVQSHRTQLIASVGGTADQALEELAATLTEPVATEFREARAAARRAGSAVARELAINQHIIQRALDAGEAFIQRLFSTVAQPNPVYEPGSKRDRSVVQRGGVLVNRTA